MNIGVLGLQGAVSEHLLMLRSINVEGKVVKHVEDLRGIDGLIIPGGESTTIGRLMKQYGFIEQIRQFSNEKKPVFGTCAGMISLASQIRDQQESYLELMDITVARNAFGRQKDSFEVSLPIDHIGDDIQAVFIRAPLIEKVGPNVEVLASFDDSIVMARQEHLLATSFHPELTNDSRVHQYFVNMVSKYVFGDDSSL
ncbi:pyridoxal 5'-phosphate synthase glutaminase subunit PdxT [Paenibacillus sp. J2TS4]|uniref:pyridoxal 5'-phosphate synthase glutaminase subunit PdxT n=1 Tax=Paenibacillus sp. J2TS4 TaxID=2807194 RepID=UPI001B18CEDC|nr:pyridoxal 5'-phosphate synthase glutaminase subunit PdxT [Paenibacillus sp. J2TS4]GIP31945.1 pyridoxal 5'-phosphate synthase subunit PdxT [Paenibacillus sp. J2TS4]